MRFTSVARPQRSQWIFAASSGLTTFMVWGLHQMKRAAGDQVSFGARRLDCRVASTTEPKMSALAAMRRIVIVSPKKVTPPAAAITGTESCTRAARVTDRYFNAAYQAV